MDYAGLAVLDGPPVNRIGSMKHKGSSTSFRFTPKQMAAFDQLCKTIKEKRVDVVKMALSLLCKKHDIYWPKNLE